jgi:hypothetical protein
VVVAALDEQVVAELQPLAHEIALALIRQELSTVAATLNGSLSGHQLPQEATSRSPATPDPPPSAEPQTRRCSHCRQTKRGSEFSPGHYVCKPCRREEWRRKQRKAVESEDEPAGLPG